MMARKRVLDPSIWTDDGMAELTPRQQLLYIGLISNADDEGRQKASPVAIRLNLPTIYANTKDGEIDADLSAVLRKMRQLVAYIADERRYLVFFNYSKWQRIDRPSPSKFPGPVDCASPRRTLDESSTNVRPELIEEKGIEEKRSEATSAKPQRTLKRATPIPQPFDISDEMYEFGATLGFNDEGTRRESLKFVNYFLGNGKVMKDWNATWENWLLRANENKAQGQWTGRTK